MGCKSSKAVEAPKEAPAASPAPTLLEQEKAPTKPVQEFRPILGATFPDFECETTQGRLRFHDLLVKEGTPAWTLLLSHPGDFSAVSATELAICSRMVGKLAKTGAKLVSLSCDPVSNHSEWVKDILAVKNNHSGILGSLLDMVEDALGMSEHDLGFPVIFDEKRELATLLGMLDTKGSGGSSVPLRTLYVIGPDRTNRAAIHYPAGTGRSFAEVLRVVESLIITQDVRIATPGNWEVDGRVVLSPDVSAEVAQEKFDNLEVKELASGKPYLRFVDSPGAPKLTPVPVSETQAEVGAGAPVMQEAMVSVGATFPDFACNSTEGDFSFHEFLERSPQWTIFFTQPRNFNPVATSELAIADSMAPQLRNLGCKLICLCGGPVSAHRVWSQDVLSAKGSSKSSLDFPIIADEKSEIAAKLGILDPRDRDSAGVALPASAAFVIGPDKKNRATLLYPATTGRSFDELQRVLLSLKVTQDGFLATPGNWEWGEPVVLTPAAATEDAQERFDNMEVKDLPSQQPYLCLVPCPDDDTVGRTAGGQEGRSSSPSAALQEAEAEVTLGKVTATDQVDVAQVAKGGIWCC